MDLSGSLRTAVAVAAVAGLFSLSGEVAAQEGPDKTRETVRRLRAEYEASRTLQERRAIAIRAIDEGLIRRTPAPQSVRVVEAIFGTRPMGPGLFGTAPLDRDLESAWNCFRTGGSRPRTLYAVDLAAGLTERGPTKIATRHLFVEGTSSGEIPFLWIGNCLPPHGFGSEDSGGTTESPPCLPGPEAPTAREAIGPDAATDEYRRLNQTLRDAASQSARVAVLLEAVDRGLIRRGGPLKAVNEIFGRRCGAAHEFPRCQIEFLGPHDLEGGYGSRLRELADTQWSLWVTYDAERRIRCVALLHGLPK